MGHPQSTNIILLKSAAHELTGISHSTGGTAFPAAGRPPPPPALTPAHTRADRKPGPQSGRFPAKRPALAKYARQTGKGIRCDRLITAGLALLWSALALAAAAAELPALPQNDLIGEPAAQVAGPGDTLLDLARRHDLGYVEIRLANPGIDPWLPQPGRLITLPMQHLLPAAPRHGIVINLAELRLYYYPPGGHRPRSFPISVGDEGKNTRLGETRVVRKTRWPSWTPTASERAEDPALPTTVPAGPENPMGEFAMYLAWPSYAIHGTNKPLSIGRRGSHGCIRLYPEDIDLLYQLVPVGTPVNVVHEQAKVGWANGELLLEVHPNIDDANAVEASGRRRSTGAYDAEALVRDAAGDQVWRVDWDAVFLMGLEQSGMPQPITRTRSPALDPGQ